MCSICEFKRKDRSIMPLNNKGVTIMEMIVVMAIIAILSGLVGLSYQYIHNANIEKAGENLAAAIKSARTVTMAKGQENGKITLISEGGRLYYRIGDSTEKNELCTQTIGFYILDSDSTPTTATNIIPPAKSGDGTWEIKFNTAGMLDTANFVANYFVFFKGNRCYSVLIYPETGKVETTLFYH